MAGVEWECSFPGAEGLVGGGGGNFPRRRAIFPREVSWGGGGSGAGMGQFSRGQFS